MKKRNRFWAIILGWMMIFSISGCGMQETVDQKKFVDLPGAGIYIADPEEKLYEVQIEPGSMEKDGVKVELKNFYATARRFYGDVFLTGNLLEMTVEEDEKTDSLLALEEKYKIIWYFGDEQRKMIDGDHGSHGEGPADGKILYNEFRTQCEEYLYLEEKGIDTYYLQVEGFDEKFTLKVVEPRRFASMDEWGYAQELNGNTIAAQASILEEGIFLEYYRDLTDEAAPLYEKDGNFDYTIIPNRYEMMNPRRVLNKDGQELRIGKVEKKMNGNGMFVEGSAEDFPLEFYFSGFSGTSGEEHTISIPIPEMGVKLTENLPKAEFEYGTVEIFSVERNGGLKFTYDVTAKEGTRQMYAVQMKTVNEDGETHLGGGGNWKADGEVIRGEINVLIDNIEADAVDVVLYNPSHWIEGEYNITIEKPAEE